MVFERGFKKMCQVVGFARVSTQRQKLDRQIANIKALYPQAVIITEKYTGTTMARKEWDKLFNMAMSGKVNKIVFDSVSRMSRNAEEGFEVYKQLFEHGVELEFLKEPHINTATYKEALNKQIEAVKTGDEATDELMKAIIDGINRYMLRLAEQQIKIAFNQSQKEVDDLHTRISEGILQRKLRGEQVGAVKGRKNTVKKASPAKEKILKYSKTFGGTMDDKELMEYVKISHNTLYKYKREIQEEMANT